MSPPKLKPMSREEMFELACVDPAAAHVRMADRLHRAMLVDGACLRPHGDRIIDVYTKQPLYQRGWWDDGYEGSQLSDADIARRIDSWARLVAPEPREHDIAYETLLLLMRCTREEWAVIGFRAAQEHVGRESWRRIGKRMGMSKDSALRLHRNVVQVALARFLNGAAERAA